VVIKIISLSLFSVLVASCSYYAEKKRVGACSITDLPYGEVGRITVRCPDLSFTVFYDNDPDGRDAFVKKIEGEDFSRILFEKINPFTMMSADVEMDGYAVKEVWEGDGVRLETFEFFADGGRVCYDWEEGYSLAMVRDGRKYLLLDEVWEGTECR